LPQECPDREPFIRANTLVIHPDLPKASERDHLYPQLRLEEAIGLARAIDLNIVSSDIIRIRKISPSTYFGSGTIETIQHLISSHHIELVIIDTSLSPIQQRNLEKKWKTKVLDRTALILEIFGARASSAEGRLQVELAALMYQRSRLVRSWTHLERQRGGLGFVGGPGETQIEVDRRLIDKRIVNIKKSLKKVVAMRELHRKSRRCVPYPIVALVGYTNAGKSTLFNRLTHANVRAEDLLFATLDPTMRLLRLPSGRQIILSDTVGFISHLPTQLVAAFRATLEEVYEADLLLHIRDISHIQTYEQKEDVEKILKEMGLENKMHTHLFEVLNKMDLLRDEEQELAISSNRKFAISAHTGQGVETLLKAIDQHLALKEIIYPISITVADGAALAWLHAHGTILAKKIEDMTLDLEVLLSPKNYERFKSLFL